MIVTEYLDRPTWVSGARPLTVRSPAASEEQQGLPQARNRWSKDPEAGTTLATPRPLQSATLVEDLITLLETARTPTITPHLVETDLPPIQHKKRVDRNSGAPS